jgi:formylglycine-generating enzyme required for sulfatase activity
MPFTRSLVSLWVVLLVPACVSVAQPEVRKVVVRGESELEDYEEKFPDALVEIEMIGVPPGSITIPTPEGMKTVDVGPFWISKTEIPWDIFDLYAFGTPAPNEGMGEDAFLRPSRPYGAPDRGYGHRGFAAISMSYIAAEEFTTWLSLETGNRYRIPTEAEWEYACRAGRNDEIPAEELEEHAWFWDNAFDTTQPIGKLHGNEWELKDMLGNAAEWCWSLDGDPLACGGSFRDKSDEIGCSARKIPTARWQETDPQIPKSIFWLTDAPFMGFRVVRYADER